ncbi:uncharacterized protein CG16817 [Teleopsis dalmanni]|uniref:uncharacterized protein CG16817 n=1 Tax=Teleopsis dalmanni TaxID=139649 RepID=UPI0018CF39A0|nr:uncharacterized protein CG16817 [Teleopsis dalmanni]
MTSASGTIPPPVSWAQRHDLLYIVIEVECKDIEQKVTETSFQFKGVNVLDASKKYDVVLNLLHPIDPERVTSKNIGRCVEYTIYKKNSGSYWPSLTTDKTKLHFLKANFAKWKNESDDEDGDGQAPDSNFDFLQGDDWSNKMNALNNFDMDEEDSDDNIPSLSQNDEDDDEKEEGATDKKV